MKTLAQKLKAQQAPPADGSRRARMKPGEVYLWYMGAQAAVDLLAELAPDDTVSIRELRAEIIGALDGLVQDVANGSFNGG
jgi:hypothetical protein